MKLDKFSIPASSFLAVIAIMCANSLEQVSNNFSSYLILIDFFKNNTLSFSLLIFAACLLFPKKLRRIFSGFYRISWNTQIPFLNLIATKEPKSFSEDMVIWGETDYRVREFYLEGRNNLKYSIVKVEGFIRSRKTGLKIPILLDGMLPEETYGIPPKCDFTIRALFKRENDSKEGYPLDDFWRHFGEFELFLSFDSIEVRKVYSEKKIKRLLELQKDAVDKNLAASKKPRVKRRVC